MSLKIKNILFTGPFFAEDYIYRKNKPRTIIMLVTKKGKQYNPQFYAFKLILADQKDIEFKNENFRNKNIDNFSIFIREYKDIDEFKRDFNLLEELCYKEEFLEMKY